MKGTVPTPKHNFGSGGKVNFIEIDCNGLHVDVVQSASRKIQTVHLNEFVCVQINVIRIGGGGVGVSNDEISVGDI